MSRSRRAAAVSAVLVALVTSAPAGQAPAFNRIQLHDQFWSEGASAADLNNDGVRDVIAGPWWWEGPDFTKRHEFYPARTTFELKLGPMTRVTVPGFEGTLGTTHHEQREIATVRRTKAPCDEHAADNQGKLRDPRGAQRSPNGAACGGAPP